MGYRNTRGKFFVHQPPLTREGDKGTANPVRAAPEATVRLRCTNPITPHRFKAAYQIQCPVCHYRTVETGRVDGLTRSQKSR